MEVPARWVSLELVGTELFAYLLTWDLPVLLTCEGKEHRAVRQEVGSDVE